MIKFKVVRWKNFLSTGKNFTEIQLDRDHTTLLLGESGAGKSTLLDAITFALFNKPFRNISKPNLVNSINDKNCVCEIEFSIGNSNYKIVRGIKPNIFEIWKNNHLVNKDANSRDYQLFLEKEVLKFNIKSFKQIVVLGAAGFTPFMQLKPQDRRVIIEELLDIEVFSVMNSLLKQKISVVKANIDQANFDIQLLDEKVKLHNQYVQDLELNNENKINDNLEKIKINKNQINQLTEKNNDLSEKITDLESEISFKSHLDQKINKLQESLKSLNKDKKNLLDQINFFSDNSFCPTCEQNIDADFSKRHIHNKKEEVLSIENNVADISTVLSDSDKIMQDCQKIENSILHLQREINNNKNTISGIEQYIKKIAKETLDLKNRDISNENLNELESLSDKIEDLNKQKENLIIEKSVCDFASSVLKDSGVKSKIIKQYLPLINKYTNKFLTHMDFFVTFSIDEEFKEAIKSRGRDDFGYESFSEGEKQRIDLALLFTWRAIARMKNSINTNLLIMDEVFDSYLDINATENVIQLLKAPMFKNSNIIVISHKNTIADKFDNVIRFVKNKNFSIVK